MTIQPSFASKFNFRPDLAFHVGVEREFFIADADGTIVPQAKQALERVRNPVLNAGAFGYELSACQIESQSLPAATSLEVWQQQVALDHELDETLSALNLQRLCLEVAPKNLPLTVYPDPSGRYQQLSSQLPPEVLSAACRVTGTHFHVGMPSGETALRVYNEVIKHCDELCDMGDNSNGQRLELYKVVAPAYRPVSYTSWTEFESYAQQYGFHANPRDCWHMIRMTIHGTVEFRNFGTTDSLTNIVQWSEYCRNLCLQYS